jgi:hypothetical protein
VCNEQFAGYGYIGIVPVLSSNEHLFWQTESSARYERMSLENKRVFAADSLSFCRAMDWAEVGNRNERPNTRYALAVGVQPWERKATDRIASESAGRDWVDTKI